MKTITLVYILLILNLMILSGVKGQDTFSIVAIDSVSGEAGSAGASCVGSSTYYPQGAKVLSDVIPGIGVIHTQAYYHSTNQQNAHELMIQGYSPQEIIDWLITHDVSNNPSIRQYGIADYNNGFPRSSGYTGANCQDYKNHITGPGYSIQGNILLGQEILDSMEARFLNTPGSLAVRLMAALQGANVIGADTRCAEHNSSSLSSFLRVARPGDEPDSLYLDLWMAYPQNFTGTVPRDPIDSLQTLFDLWNTNTRNRSAETETLYRLINTPDGISIRNRETRPGTLVAVYDVYGRKIKERNFTIPETFINISNGSNGIFIIQIYRPGDGSIFQQKIIRHYQ